MDQNKNTVLEKVKNDFLLLLLHSPNKAVDLARAGKTRIDELGVTSTPAMLGGGPVACFPLITCHPSLLGDVRKLSREIIASFDGWVKTLFKRSGRKNKILPSNICLADTLTVCSPRTLTVPTGGTCVAAVCHLQLGVLTGIKSRNTWPLSQRPVKRQVFLSHNQPGIGASPCVYGSKNYRGSGLLFLF